MWETKLSEALNLYEAIVLKIVYFFETFDIVKMVTSAGQVVLHLLWIKESALIIVILLNKACIIKTDHI